MAIAYNPRTVTDGLVFSYDMGNPQKSWKGAPTVNLTPDMGIVAIQSVSVTYVGLEDGWKKYSLNGTWTSGTYPYSMATDAITFTGGVTYSTSMYIKTNVPAKFASLFSGMNYVNQPMNNVGTSFSILQPDGSFYVGRTGFQYTSTTSQNGYLLSQPVVSQVFSSATDFVYIKSGQIEANAFPTPFVAGTRSNTQAVLDLSNNRTVTANSLTYNSDGTFSFSGSNYISTTGITSTNALTVNMILKVTSDPGNYRGFIGSNDGTNNDYQIGFNSDMGAASGASVNAIFVEGAGISPVNYLSSSSAFNQWFNLCVVISSTTVTMYVNGVQNGSISRVSAATIATNFLTIGARPVTGTGTATSYGFTGSVAVTQIYNRALTAAEVQQNFNALRGRFSI